MNLPQYKVDSVKYERMQAKERLSPHVQKAKELYNCMTAHEINNVKAWISGKRGCPKTLTKIVAGESALFVLLVLLIDNSMYCARLNKLHRSIYGRGFSSYLVNEAKLLLGLPESKSSVKRDGRPYPSEYRRRCVAMALGKTFDELGREVVERHLAVSCTTIVAWTTSFKNNGCKAFDSITHLPDKVLSEEEMDKLSDIDTSVLDAAPPLRKKRSLSPSPSSSPPPSPPLSLPPPEGSALQVLMKVQQVLSFHKSFPDQLSAAGALDAISKVLG